MMKSIPLLATFLAAILFTSCTPEGSSNFSVAETEIWILKNVKGGIAGVDDNFEENTVFWDLRINDGVIIVSNQYDGDNFYSGLDSGSYPYTIKTAENDARILVVGGEDFGQLTVTEDSVTVDQNITSEGQGSDGFILQFDR